MLFSGEANAGERWKKTIRLSSKKGTLHLQHTFSVHFFAVLLHDCNVKLPETSQLHVLRTEMSYVFSFTFFHCRSLSPCIGGRQHFSFCHHHYKIVMSPLFLISRSRSLSPFITLNFAGLPPTLSFSLSFSCSIFQICGHDN